MTAALFEPLQVRSLRLKNRIVISPMMQHAAPGGFANNWHLVHLGKFALGGAGLIFTESTAVSPVGRIGKDDAGMWLDAHVAPWKNVVDFVHEHGAAIGIQLGHAGRKAGSKALWEGGEALSPEEMSEVDPRWIRIGPSPVAAGEGWSVPDEMTQGDIDEVVQQFVDSTRRSDAAGFDAIELHFGHGYLVTSFLSPISNLRTDEYGGSREGRMRLAIRIARGVRAAWPDEKPLWCRLSVVDGAVGGWDVDDTVALVRALQAVGVDVIDCSSGGLTEQTKALPVPRGLGFQVPFSRRIKRDTGATTQAVGMIVDARQAEEVVGSGSADLVAIGREALYDPYWPVHAQATLQRDPKYRDWNIRHRVWLEKRQVFFDRLDAQKAD
ncbi:NADH:flavin oxidoreductase/NADH oxidase [Variovorax ureilyticus]|uniref:NADH:flavin oxidoreductase/NADH oxidase n=1 Tax=Variovorax ureilyticus TaxID=1836198 RepID=A0ABU8VHC9_9BURK